MSTYLPAFMSHAHLDNDQCDRYFHELTQHGVTCYYDRDNPQTGNFLGDALEKELERCRALIVMVTPAAITSFWVRLEINTFLGLMANDPARKLIPVRVARCQLPAVLNGMWWVDALGRPTAEVIADIARALTATTDDPPPPDTGPFSRVVDWRQGMADHTTIVDALAAAQPGERILVRRGVYEGGLTIDKPLELIGDGRPGDVEVRASGADAIMFTASHGRVANLILRQTGGGNWFGVDIAAGRLELEDCDINSQSLTCVAIHNGANPVLRRNRIHDGKQGGVIVYEKGQGLLEDNDISANTLAGVEIKAGSAPTLRRNRIHKNQGGVFINQQGQGLLEDNDIFTNTLAGIQISEGSAPTLRRNRIHDGKQGGVFVNQQGLGLLVLSLVCFW